MYNSALNRLTNKYLGCKWSAFDAPGCEASLELQKALDGISLQPFDMTSNCTIEYGSSFNLYLLHIFSSNTLQWRQSFCVYFIGLGHLFIALLSGLIMCFEIYSRKQIMFLFKINLCAGHQ